MPSFRPTLRANLFAEGSGAMTIYEEGAYPYYPARRNCMISCRLIRKSCVCRLCKHDYISARGSHGKGSAFETTTTTEFNAYIRAETGILGSAHSNTDIIFRFPQHKTVSFAAVLRQGLQRRVAGRMPVYGEALRKAPRDPGFRKGHLGCRSIYALFIVTLNGYGGR